MNKFYEVDVGMTSRPMGNKSEDEHGYRQFHQEKETFKTIDEVKAYLWHKYNNCKRTKMYVDRTDGTQHIGYIYSFKSYEWEGAKKIHFWQQDWVTIREMQSKPILIHN